MGERGRGRAVYCDHCHQPAEGDGTWELETAKRLRERTGATIVVCRSALIAHGPGDAERCIMRRGMAASGVAHGQ